jgi:serine protease Do
MGPLTTWKVVRMSDTLRTRLNLILTAVVAFAVGLAITAPLDVPSDGIASSANEPLRLDVRESDVSRSNIASTGFSEIAESITPAVVTINVRRPGSGIQLPPQFGEDDGTRPGSGSGFIITPDGYIVTNNHVVEEAVSIEVLLSDGRVFDNVRLIGRDETTDVALLKIDAPNLTHVPLGSSEATRVGDWVLAVGSPGFRFGTPLTTSVTAGIVSAKGRNIRILNELLAIEDFIQTDAVINPGNSGGPLINAAGEVIGVNAAIASTTGNYQGYGFAVPIDLVREVVEDLVEYGTVKRALLGVSVRGVDDADARYYGLDRVGGAKVHALTEGSPARASGIQVGDVITAVGGRAIVSVSDLQRHVRRFEPGDEVEVEIVRETGEAEVVSLNLAAAPSAEPAPVRTVSNTAERDGDPIGIEVATLSATVRRSLNVPATVDGVVVTGMVTDGPFHRRALYPGLDRSPVITRVNRQDIESVADYERAMRDVQPGDVVGLTVYNTHPEASSEIVIPMTVPVPSSP